MSDLNLNKDLNASNQIDKKQPANDDDLFAANLIEQINKESTGKWLLKNLLFSSLYIILTLGIFYLLNINKVSSIESFLSLFSSRQMQLYGLLCLLPIPVMILFVGMAKKLNELTIISDGLLKSALRLTHPEKSSGKAISTLSNAIRSEIELINIAINDAIKKASDLEEKLGKEVVDIEKSISSSESKLMTIIDDLRKQKLDIIEASSSTSNEIEKIMLEYDNKSTELGKVISNYSNKLSEIDDTFKDRLSNFNDSLNSIDQSTKVINQNSEDIIDNLDITNEKIRDQYEILALSKNEIASSISELNNDIKDQNTILINSVSSLTDVNRKIKNNILDNDSLLDQINKTIEPKLTSTLDSLKNTMEELGEKSAQFEYKMNSTSKTITDSINSQMEDEINNSEKISSSLDDIRNTLSAEVQKQIEDINLLFKDIKEATNEIIDKQRFEIENSFDQKVLEFNAKTKMMIESIREVTNETTNELNLTIKNVINTISSGHEQAIQISDSELSKIHNNSTEKMLSISEDIINKSNEINSIAVDGVRNTAKQLAEEIVLMENSTKNLSIEITDKLSSASMKFTKDLSSLQKDAISEIHKNISDISVSYKENARELTEISNNLSQSLDNTRNSLREDILYLPDETKEHLEKMRSVISEQISAISHLNKLIDQYDVSNDIEKKERYDSKNANKGKINTNKINRNTYDWLLPEILSPQARMNEKKISADNQNLENLENEIISHLKIDIDKLFLILPDQNPSKLWESYYNGIDIFSDKIYSRTGKRIYNNIKNKYTENKNFRSASNKFLKNFEDILKNHQKENDESEINSILDSTSGILYLLISHAIGKLD